MWYIISKVILMTAGESIYLLRNAIPSWYGPVFHCLGKVINSKTQKA